MENIIVIIKCLFLLGILWGYFYLVSKKLKVNLFVIPIFVISTIATMVYIGGLVGQLLFITYLLAGLGILSCIYLGIGLYKNSLIFFRIPIVGICVLLGFFVFLQPIIDAHFVHYDNFSHWLVVVKELLITNSFPDTTSTLIEFTNYPLGTASFIYFVCKIVGTDDWIMLMAQNIIVFACFFAIFAIVKERKRVLLTLFLAMGCSLFSCFNLTTRINNLLVDFLLPVLTLAIIVVIYIYQKEVNKLFLLMIPMINFLLIIKNIGIMYVFIACSYLLYVLIVGRKHIIHQLYPSVVKEKNGERKATLFLVMKGMLTFMLCFLSTFFWKVHIRHTFPSVVNKFSMDIGQFMQEFQTKTLNEIEEIILLYINTILDITSRLTLGYLTTNVIAISSWVIAYKIFKKNWKLLRILILSNTLVILYHIGILSMYLFQMPSQEAVLLAGFERYASSILILFMGLIVLCITVDLENSFYYRIGEKEDYRSFKSIETKNAYGYAVIGCLMILSLVLTSEYNGILYNNDIYEETLPAKVKSVVGDSWSEEVDDHRYLVYASDQNEQVTSFYLEYIARYYLRANNVDTICMFYEDNMMNLIKQYDYLIVIESDFEEQELMQEYFAVDGLPGIYKIADLDFGISN